MWKMIFIQLWNERKSNLLIWLELLVVAVFLWYASDALYLNYKEYSQPVGFDISHVYYVQLGVVPQESADCDTTQAHLRYGGGDFMTAYDRLAHHPKIESVCYTAGNHFHYRGNNRFAFFCVDSVKKQGFVRDVDPAYFRVFRVKPAPGSTSEGLEQALRENSIVITGSVADGVFGNAPDALRKEIWITDQGQRDSSSYRVGAVCEAQRYDEFQPYQYAYYRAIPTEDIRASSAGVSEYLNLFVRVKPAVDNSRFAADLRREMAIQLRFGNLYLKDVIPMSYYRTEKIRQSIDDVRLYISCIAFFLLNVLLGVIGTFWFRTEQRRSEIGLRMAMGASRVSIFRLLMGEGILVLLAAFVPALIIFLNMVRLGLTEPSGIELPLSLRLLFGLSFTGILLAVMIVIGISFPAYRAMKLQPADALHDE